ncbi:MAG TPA: SOS response-associated peptidase [Ilumatobacteraceae bacterium]|nr:SOS response-associated peptidase [Ilumatobacteraceae bacterium]
MCGRFVSSSPPDELAKYFDVDAVAEQVIEPNYNVAPSQDVFVVVESGGVRRLDRFRWGLVPFWAKDPTTGYKMINARAESVTDKNAYKRAFQKRRCIIPADGFFEWKKIPGQKAKQPYFIRRADGEPMAFAGLWEVWRPKDAPEDSEPLRTCTIITGEPNEKVADIHDRMPVMLPPSTWAEWLDRDNADVETLGKFLVPAPASLYALHPVTRAVNNVQENGPELIDPAEEPLDGVLGQDRLL